MLVESNSSPIVTEAIKKLHMLLLPVPAENVTALDVCRDVSERVMEIITLLQKSL